MSVVQSHTTQKGRYGERIACRYLANQGFTIVAQNYMPTHGIKRGEIDIVAERDGVIHFVEVKARFITASDAYRELPEVRITRAKLRALERTAQVYLREHKCVEREYHFDALSIEIDRAAHRAQVRYLVDIFL
jgi:putative endonuclease